MAPRDMVTFVLHTGANSFTSSQLGDTLFRLPHSPKHLQGRRTLSPHTGNLSEACLCHSTPARKFRFRTGSATDR